MRNSDELKVEHFEIEIDCPDCESGRMKVLAWADLNGLDRMEVETVAELRIEDIRRLASYGEGGIDGECDPRTPPAPPAAVAQRLGELGGSLPRLAGVPRRRPKRDG